MDIAGIHSFSPFGIHRLVIDRRDHCVCGYRDDKNADGDKARRGCLHHPLRRAPDTFPQGNSTVIIGEREALVVDSCYMSSSAAEDIAQIRQWTNKPVRYLVNTHWHFDHTMGNGVYWDAFPGLSIVAHTETARQIAGYNPGWFERFPKRGERLKQIVATGKDTTTSR